MTGPRAGWGGGPASWMILPGDGRAGQREGSGRGWGYSACPMLRGPSWH